MSHRSFFIYSFGNILFESIREKDVLRDTVKYTHFKGIFPENTRSKKHDTRFISIFPERNKIIIS